MKVVVLKYILNIFFSLLVIHGVIFWCIMTLIVVLKSYPGRIIGFTFAFYLIGLVTISMASVGIKAIKKDIKRYLRVYFIGTIVLMVSEILLGIMPWFYYSFRYANLYNIWTMKPGVHITFGEIEDIYGCCGMTSYRDYMGTIPSSCCSYTTCSETGLFLGKPGCGQAIRDMASYMLATAIMVYLAVIIQSITLIFTWKLKVQMPN